jgi:uncharacterized protein (DUF934 family)
MAIIIKDRKLAVDSWRRLDAAADGGAPAVPAEGDVVVPLAVWQAQRDALMARPGRAGVWVDGDEEPAAFADDLPRLGVVAVNFPKFSDGRGCSLAHLLRLRYGYRGELRAIGDVLRDQLYYLSNCGFDAFALRADQDPQQALSAFDDFSDHYQSTVGRLPLFRRRLEQAHPEREREKAA